MRAIFEDDPNDFVTFQSLVTQAIILGWKPESLLGAFSDHFKDFFFKDNALVVRADDDTEWEFSWRDVVYRHDFAKIVLDDEISSWDFHLKKAVSCDKPLNYYLKVLNENQKETLSPGNTVGQVQR